MVLDRWDTCFLISKMKILDRGETLAERDRHRARRRRGATLAAAARARQSSLVHTKTVARQNYLPLKSEKVLQHEAQNIIANNYLKRKQLGIDDGERRKRKLKRPILFPDAYTNRDVMQIPCYTFPR